jgi:hypothetical protein
MMSGILFWLLLWVGLLNPLANFSGVSLVSAAAAPEWEKTLAAARKEGKVVVAIPLGEAYPRVIAAFQKAYPDIKPEPFSIHTRDFMSRYRKEREVGQILWDALIGGPDSDIYGAAQQGYWDAVKPDLVLPVVQEVQENRLRTDVPVPEPGRVPPEGKTIIN